MSETAATHAFLAAREKVTAMPHKQETSPASSGTVAMATLDQRHRAVLATLLRRPTWSAMEFKRVASKISPMPLALVVTLNEWSQARFGDCVLRLESDQTITVNKDIKSFIEL